jgi:uncharacterized membrane protein YgaE (UPF0421/DUF939 family)
MSETERKGTEKTSNPPGSDFVMWTRPRRFVANVGQTALRRFGLRDGVLAGFAAVVAYELPHVLGWREALWGALSAIAAIQSDLGSTQSFARTQFTGAAIGGAVGMVMLLLFGRTAVLFGLAIVLAVVACAALKVAKAGQTAGITCTIVMMAPPIGSPERELFARVGEVGWGILVAVVLVWIAERFFSTRRP